MYVNICKYLRVVSITPSGTGTAYPWSHHLTGQHINLGFISNT